MNAKGKFTLAGTFVFLTLSIAVSSCEKDTAANPFNGEEKATTSTSATTTDCLWLINPSDTISQEEADMLIYMREEEKLARDVYLEMYDLYPLPIFRNISKSENFHMTQVLCLLDYYNIPDPASADTGVFNNSELQDLYDALVAQGSTSLVEALTVGATIEDKDIFDLSQNLVLTSNPAIINVFEHLQCASGNHLRSFSAWLTNKGVTYEPQYISQEEYDDILSLPHQFCGGPIQPMAVE